MTTIGWAITLLAIHSQRDRDASAAASPDGPAERATDRVDETAHGQGVDARPEDAEQRGQERQRVEQRARAPSASRRCRTSAGPAR